MFDQVPVCDVYKCDLHDLRCLFLVYSSTTYNSVFSKTMAASRFEF